MKNNKRIHLIFLIGLLPIFISANTVVKSPASLKSLEAGWEWAVKNAGHGKAFYIGYTFQRLMNENSHIGSWNSETSHKITLYEMITGKKAEIKRNEKSVSELAKEILERKKTKKTPGKKVLKDVALLFRFSGDYKNRYDCQTVKLTHLKVHVALEKGTVYWLDRFEKKESLNFLYTFFDKTGSDSMKKKIVAAVGMHGAEAGAFSFFKKVITGSYAHKIRKDAIFWVGEHETSQCVKFLFDLTSREKSSDLKEHAVFSLYRIDLDEADNVLVSLARKSKDRGVRKKAIFWLGQKASDRSAKVLSGIVKDDPDCEIQKQAVFALSQLSKGKGIQQLITIAKTHRNLNVRKQAIFWLGQSDDPKALDTIIDILKIGK